MTRSNVRRRRDGLRTASTTNVCRGRSASMPRDGSEVVEIVCDAFEPEPRLGDPVDVFGEGRSLRASEELERGVAAVLWSCSVERERPHRAVTEADVDEVRVDHSGAAGHLEREVLDDGGSVRRGVRRHRAVTRRTRAPRAAGRMRRSARSTIRRVGRRRSSRAPRRGRGVRRRRTRCRGSRTARSRGVRAAAASARRGLSAPIRPAVRGGRGTARHRRSTSTAMSLGCMLVRLGVAMGPAA